MPQLLERLKEIAGEARVVSEGDDLAYYGRDRCRGSWPVDPLAIVFPATTHEVSEIVRACAAERVAIVPSGGRTGLAGAATAIAGEVVVSLERMRKIIEVDARAQLLRCEAGATVERVQNAASEVGLMYPVDFAAKGTAQIGGSVATNAGGVKVVRYGLTRDWVAGLKVVLASGEVVELGGELVKDNTGYDLRQLMIGSEGTLGIITEVTLRLCRPPLGLDLVLCGVPDDGSLLQLFARLRDHGLAITAFECLDHRCLEHVVAHRPRGLPFAEPSARYALCEVEVLTPGASGREQVREQLTTVLGEAAQAGEIEDAVFANTAQQAAGLWALREDISESLHVHTPHKADVSLPLGGLVPFLTAWRAAAAEHLPAVPALCFGHIGDGNLHLNLLCPEGVAHAEFYAACKQFDEHTYGLVKQYRGSISAEHGVGLLKRDHLHHSRNPTEVSMMRSLKRALDPQGLLNPGKIFR